MKPKSQALFLIMPIRWHRHSSSFYNTSPIMSAETPELAASRLQMAKLVRDVLTLLLYLLGIEAPEVMLKKAGEA